MKRALAAFLMVLVPTMALAQTTTPPADSSSSSSAAPATAPAATATAKPAAKKDEKHGGLANAVQARTPEEQAKQSGFQVQMSLDNWLGTGTFVDPTQYSYLASNLTIQPIYLMPFIGGKRLVISGTARLTYEYTLPDAETGRRWTWWDLGFGASVPAAFTEKLTGIAVSPNIGLTLPSSPESFNAGLITSLRAGASFSRRAGPIDLRMNVSGSRAFYTKPFNGLPNPNYDPTRPSSATNLQYLPQQTTPGGASCLARNNEPYCAFAGWNPAWSLSIGGSAQWRATDSFMIYAGYTYLYSWREMATATVDDFTSKAVDTEGNPVARAGYGRSDRTSAFVGGSYQLNDHYSIDLGVSTIQTPLTPTGEVRFPFLSFGTWSQSNTTFYFTLSAAY